MLQGKVYKRNFKFGRGSELFFFLKCFYLFFFFWWGGGGGGAGGAGNVLAAPTSEKPVPGVRLVWEEYKIR